MVAGSTEAKYDEEIGQAAPPLDQAEVKPAFQPGTPSQQKREGRKMRVSRT